MSAPHADRDHSEQPVTGPLCARCGQPALGFATINGVRYCHADERSCYTEQCHENPTHARKAARQSATPSTATAGSDPTQGASWALGGAESGEWRARCDVPGCEWFSLPYKAREGADTAGYNHWLSKGHGSTIRGRR